MNKLLIRAGLTALLASLAWVVLVSPFFMALPVHLAANPVGSQLMPASGYSGVSLFISQQGFYAYLTLLAKLLMTYIPFSFFTCLLFIWRSK